MSPENSFPTPINDCYKVTLHVMQNSKEYGVDLSKLVLAGDSAGERKPINKKLGHSICISNFKIKVQMLLLQ
jgi:hypothetical protein